MSVNLLLNFTSGLPFEDLHVQRICMFKSGGTSEANTKRKVSKKGRVRILFGDI